MGTERVKFYALMFNVLNSYALSESSMCINFNFHKFNQGMLCLIL